MRRSEIALTLALTLATAFPALADDAPKPVPQAQAAADVLTLSDGRKITGRIVAEDDRFVSIESAGTTRAYPRDTITSIERAPRPAADKDPAGGAAGSPAGTPAPQPPGKDGKQKKGDRKDAPLSETAKAWLDALIAKSAEGDETVRRSVAAAISALGRPAIPAVRAAADAAQEGPQKQFLTRLAEVLDSRGDRKMRGDGAGPDAPMPGPDAPGRADPGRKFVAGLMARLSAELELRDEQKPKVEAVVQDIVKRRAQLQRAAQTEGFTAEQLAEKATALRTEMLAQMKAILDEPQYALFQEMAERLVETPKARDPAPPKDAGTAPAAPQPGNDPPK
jgi:hypothetical protein